MFAYAGAMFAVVAVFIFLSIFYYEYTDYSMESVTSGTAITNQALDSRSLTSDSSYTTKL